MSLPETCPFCGSGSELRNGEKWVGYTCITTIHAGHDARRMQSITCAGLERTRLLARVAELEVENKGLRDRFSDSDTERNAAQAGLKAAFARVAELESRCKRLEEAAREVYIDSIVSDHRWNEQEISNMRALRDVLEAKP